MHGLFNQKLIIHLSWVLPGSAII